MKILKCKPDIDETTEENIKIAVEEIRKGKLVVYPTETVYGLAADVYNPTAIKKLYLTKKRPFDMPLSVAVSNKNMAENVAIITRPVEKLMDAFMPGPLTIITQKNPEIPDIVTSMSKKVGIRIPDNKIALKIADEFGPIITTSANLHSKPDAISVDAAVDDFGDQVSVYLDSGKCTLGKPSTIVWIMGDDIEIMRQGTISKKQIEDVLNAD